MLSAEPTLALEPNTLALVGVRHVDDVHVLVLERGQGGVRTFPV